MKKKCPVADGGGGTAPPSTACLCLRVGQDTLEEQPLILAYISAYLSLLNHIKLLFHAANVILHMETYSVSLKSQTLSVDIHVSYLTESDGTPSVSQWCHAHRHGTYGTYPFPTRANSSTCAWTSQFFPSPLGLWDFIPLNILCVIRSTFPLTTRNVTAMRPCPSHSLL